MVSQEAQPPKGLDRKECALKKIDCHRHCSFDPTDLQTLPQSARALSIDKIFLFGHNGIGDKGFDETIWNWYVQHPSLIVPLACDFSYQKEDIAYATACLKKGFFGFGELLIGHNGARKRTLGHVQYDDPIPLSLFHLAGQCHAFVLAHCNPLFGASFLRAVAQCPETTFIWAHIAYDFSKGLAGELACAREIEALLLKYNNLSFDISFWKKDAICMNTPHYLDLLERHSTRFLWGLDATDHYAQSQADFYPSHRTVLAQLSAIARENILHGNAQRLIEKRLQYIRYRVDVIS